MDPVWQVSQPALQQAAPQGCSSRIHLASKYVPGESREQVFLIARAPLAEGAIKCLKSIWWMPWR
jgi:hypothetical protein